jgi:hypothetical protein
VFGPRQDLQVNNHAVSSSLLNRLTAIRDCHGQAFSPRHLEPEPADPRNGSLARGSERSGALGHDRFPGTCSSDWRVLDIKDIEQATVASVTRLFEATGLTHIPVMETSESGEQRLRGLLSGAKVRRLLSR